MSTLDLTVTDPRQTASADAPEELFLAAEALAHWDEHSLRWADAILTEWVSDALATDNNREYWIELNELIERLQVIQELETQPDTLRPQVEATYHRWQGMADLLASRAHRHNQHRPEDIARRTHMDKLRQHLEQHGPDAAVGDLPAALGLSKSRISQLLSLAEAAGLISRVKQNGRRVVNLAGIWVVQQTEATTPTEKTAERGDSTTSQGSFNFGHTISASPQLLAYIQRSTESKKAA